MFKVRGRDDRKYGSSVVKEARALRPSRSVYVVGIYMYDILMCVDRTFKLFRLKHDFTIITDQEISLRRLGTEHSHGACIKY